MIIIDQNSLFQAPEGILFYINNSSFNKAIFFMK